MQNDKTERAYKYAEQSPAAGDGKALMPVIFLTKSRALHHAHKKSPA